ncbi:MULTISPECIES: hypothetical protein [Mesorhizobium]|uniref:Yip1 domain-containing protein n=1 Tax=Mesorhizobium japonicum R7A TaxID=935547 RepID=A0ABX6MM63_9HYPH|nr:MULTISPECIES: hypothetical protein [Mesorhizobium]MBE1710265.1 hypothetical protein [Mesorhizobium japonicum]MBE1712163.1 hypothetical protein [Mesorhizobium japonicum]MUT20380.1 hypothetical protein [Mesorhizobium japonicum]MUT31508.1 hypothetical protein [Mesorhizobium japonicum]QJF00449.1 hypothetical protein R7A2020_05650 [Mesorhizobium japonicum R7A]
MKDLIDKILAYLPKYISECGLVISGPKTFIASKIDSERRIPSNDCLIFLAITIAVTTMLGALLPSGKDIYLGLASNAATGFFSIALFSFTISISWWLVGGRAPYREFFTVLTYLVGPAALINSVFVFLAYGVLRTFDHQTFDALAKVTYVGDRSRIIIGSIAFIPFICIIYAGVLAISVFSIIGWGAYRNITGLSRMKSFFALLISGMLSVPGLLLLWFISMAVS